MGISTRIASTRGDYSLNCSIFKFENGGTMAITELNKRDWMALEQQYYQGTFKRYPITLVRGEGARVWDSDGKVYLDFVAGIAVNILGHCHPAIIQAVQQQVTQLVHISNLYYNVRQIELAELLSIQSNG